MIKHIVMWDILGAGPDEKARNAQRLKAAFEGMQPIPGLLKLEIGLDLSGVDYACDVVLYSEFASRQALDDYARQPLPPREQDSVRRDRKKARDEQFRLRCGR